MKRKVSGFDGKFDIVYACKERLNGSGEDAGQEGRNWNNIAKRWALLHQQGGQLPLSGEREATNSGTQDLKFCHNGNFNTADTMLHTYICDFI